MNQPDLSKLLANIQNNKENWVLVMNGSYNPIHIHHTKALDLAKEQIEFENKNVCVACAFLSTSGDNYVKKKLGSHWIPNNHRYQMIKLATEYSSFQEALGSGIMSPFHTLKLVLNSIKSHNKLGSNKNIKVFEVHGADTIIRCMGRGKKLFTPMIILGWGDDTKKIKEMMKTNSNLNKYLILIDCDLDGSSSKIRENNELDLLNPTVKSYMENYSLIK